MAQGTKRQIQPDRQTAGPDTDRGDGHQGDAQNGAGAAYQCGSRIVVALFGHHFHVSRAEQAQEIDGQQHDKDGQSTKGGHPRGKSAIRKRMHLESIVALARRGQVISGRGEAGVAEVGHAEARRRGGGRLTFFSVFSAPPSVQGGISRPFCC